MKDGDLPEVVQRVLARKKKRTQPWWRAFRNLPLYWFHQRFRYMDMSERIFHLLLNFLFWTIFFLVLWAVGAIANIWTNAMVSFILSRTLSYICNDNFWTGLMHSFKFVENPGIDKMIEYLMASQFRLAACKSIHAYAVYGGMVRGNFNVKSDLDVRYLRKSGLMHAVVACASATKERVIALTQGIPLDSYVGDNVSFLDKIRPDEHPLVLKDSEGQLAAKYGQGTLSIELFVKLRGC